MNMHTCVAINQKYQLNIIEFLVEKYCSSDFLLSYGYKHDTRMFYHSLKQSFLWPQLCQNMSFAAATSTMVRFWYSRNVSSHEYNS